MAVCVIAGGINSANVKRLSSDVYAKSDSGTGKTAEDTDRKGKDAEDCEAYLEEATQIIKRLRQILIEERKRWKHLHGNPVPDEVKVTYDDEKKRMIINVKIDPKVRNAVNKQPITRKYMLDYRPKKSVIDYFDLILGSAWSYRIGYRPLSGIGIRPFSKFKTTNYLSDFGVGLYTTIYSGGFFVYWAPKDAWNLSVSVLVGSDWKGKAAPGLGIGLRF